VPRRLVVVDAEEGAPQARGIEVSLLNRSRWYGKRERDDGESYGHQFQPATPSRRNGSSSDRPS
jgi:hypothetical protein